MEMIDDPAYSKGKNRVHYLRFSNLEVHRFVKNMSDYTLQAFDKRCRKFAYKIGQSYPSKLP